MPHSTEKQADSTFRTLEIPSEQLKMFFNDALGFSNITKCLCDSNVVNSKYKRDTNKDYYLTYSC